jgi:hypothetical protein
MKKKLLAYAILPVLGLGILGAGVASAHSFGFTGGTALTPDEIATRHQEMFQNQANLLGVGVDTIKAGWAEGKSILEIAEANGITAEQLQQRMKDVRLTEMKSHLSTLVSGGVITQAQADARLTFMQNRVENGAGKMGMMGGHKIMMRGFGF